MVLQPVIDDWQQALDLRRALVDGYQPLPVPVPHCLPPEELCYAQVPVQVFRRAGIELAYPSNDPRYAASARWEMVDRGTVALTTHRLALLPAPTPHQNLTDVVSYGWQGLRSHWVERDGNILDYGPDGRGSYRRYLFVSFRPVWLHVMLSHIAFARLPQLTPPRHIARFLH